MDSEDKVFMSRACAKCGETKRCDEFPYKKGLANVEKTTETTTKACFKCNTGQEGLRVCTHCNELKVIGEFVQRARECIACLNINKQCEGCGETKALTDFYKTHHGRNGGRANKCKVCKKSEPKIMIEYKNYIDGLYVFLKNEAVHPGEDIDEAYKRSLWWIEKKKHAVLGQFYSTRTILLPLMHLSDDFDKKHKPCSRCDKKLLTTEFYRNKRYISGLDSKCKKCVKECLKPLDSEPKTDIIKDRTEDNYLDGFYEGE